MSAAPAGAMVRIYYDGGRVLRGEGLATSTGRIYLVVERRVQKRGKYKGRQHLGCVVAKEAPPGVRILPLRWYPRGKKAGVR